MAKPSQRILGSNATLRLLPGTSPSNPIEFELDKWTAKALDEKKDYKPNGQTLTTNHLIHKGWELSLECGITTDAKLISLLMAIYSHNANAAGDYKNGRGGSADKINIQVKNIYFDNTVTTFNYVDCLLYDLSVDCGMQNDEIRLTFTACCSYREVESFGNVVDGAVGKNPSDFITGIAPNSVISRVTP